jgi:hypothetical protein
VGLGAVVARGAVVSVAARVAIQRVEEMREREAGERKGGAGYTRLWSSG